MNYFTLFDLPESYDVDLTLLAERFQELQRRYHPDRFANQPESERLPALQKAATINQGYQALRKSLTRAEYLLSLHGFDINNEQQSLRDTEFLMEQMALREQLELIEQQQDSDAITEFLQQLQSSEKQRETQLRQQLAAQDWAPAAESARKIRFLARLREQAEQLEENLLDF